MTATSVSDREAFVRRGRHLEYFTVSWNAAEGLIAVLAGALAGSSEPALLDEREAPWTPRWALEVFRSALLTPRAALPVPREALVTPRDALERRTVSQIAESVPRHAGECAGWQNPASAPVLSLSTPLPAQWSVPQCGMDPYRGRPPRAPGGAHLPRARPHLGGGVPHLGLGDPHAGRGATSRSRPSWFARSTKRPASSPSSP